MTIIDITGTLADEIATVIPKTYLGWPEKVGRTERKYAVIEEGMRTPRQLDADGSELITEINVRVAVFDSSPTAVATDVEGIMNLFKNHKGRLIEYRRAWSTGNATYTAQISVTFTVDKRGLCFTG